MATTLQDEVYKTLLQISGQQASALSDVSLTLSDVVAQVQELHAAAPPANVKPPTTAAGTQASSSQDALSSIASTVLKSGFGLAPLVTGLFSLFGGGDPPAPAPLVKYALPASINFQATETASGISGLDYDQSGTARVYRAGPQGNTGESRGEQVASAKAPQITVNVQAMDSRSFMDRSNEIALAVREAMLNMNSINDVINEL